MTSPDRAPEPVTAGATRSRRGSVAVLVVLALVVAACASTDPSSRDGATGEPAGSTPPSIEEVDDSEYLFDQDQLHTFELNLSEEDLAFLDADPAAEEYVEGTLTFEGETIPVGIRYKGSIGAFIGCVEGSEETGIDREFDLQAIFNISGAKTCQKLSLKVKINWEDSNAEFFGQRRLQFHSMNNDGSQMRDRLGYWLFREMGVPASRAVHARVTVNGEYSGLYVMVEQVDGRFTRANFDDGTGNLYKEVWPLETAGQPQTEQAFLDGLKTNEDEDPSVALMRAFATEIAEASPDEAPAVIERWMDLDETIAHMVVDRTIRNDDGPSNWRCTVSFCFVHNFFWYVDPSTEQAHLIPWDLDAAFMSILDPIPLIEVVDDFGEITNECEPFDVGSFVLQRSAACDPLFAAWAQYDDDYDQLLAEFLAGPFSDESVNAQLDAWSAQIRDATADAAELHRSISIEAWEAQVQRLQESLEHARNS